MIYQPARRCVSQKPFWNFKEHEELMVVCDWTGSGELVGSAGLFSRVLSDIDRAFQIRGQRSLGRGSRTF